jgi:hypothetical protein
LLLTFAQHIPSFLPQRPIGYCTRKNQSLLTPPSPAIASNAFDGFAGTMGTDNEECHGQSRERRGGRGRIIGIINTLNFLYGRFSYD